MTGGEGPCRLPEQQELAQSSVERIVSTLESIGASVSVVREARDALLELEAKVIEQQDRVKARSVELVDAREVMRRSLLAADTEPFWHSRITLDHVREVLAGLAATVTTRRTQLDEFVGDHEGRIGLHGLILVTLLALFTILRHRSLAWAETGPKVESVRTVLSRPISAATSCAPG